MLWWFTGNVLVRWLAFISIRSTEGERGIILQRSVRVKLLINTTSLSTDTMKKRTTHVLGPREVSRLGTVLITEETVWLDIMI